MDDDGDLDLMLHFDTQALVDNRDLDLILHLNTKALVGNNGDLDEYTTELMLNGKTTGGQAVQGSDSVQIVPHRR